MGERLKGRSAIVFGAGSSGPGWGNGKAAAVAYAREGAKVAAVDLSLAAAEETARIVAEEGGEAIALCCDATDLGAVEATVAAAIARFGKIDILHNNIGVVFNGGPTEIDEATFRRALDINVGTVFRTARTLLPHFLELGRGAIVNIASLAAIRWTGYPYFAYSVSKAAVVQATQSLALQYAPHGIRANAILPGMLDTPLIYAQVAANHASVEIMVANRNRAVPMGRMGTAWDVAAASVFLASDEAGFITGVALPIDGGQSCAMVAAQ